MRRGCDIAVNGKKTPQRKVIGSRKKLAKVMASKTSLIATETNAPRNEKAVAANRKVSKSGQIEGRFKPIASVAPSQTTMLVKRAKSTPLADLASKIIPGEKGASASRSKALLPAFRKR